MTPRRDSGNPGERLRVLFVCTANQCRSPLAEAIARHDAVGDDIEFSSAGFLDGGIGMPETGRRVARELGLDLEPHRSIRVDTSRLGEYDLILTMTREHARGLVAADSDAWPRVFTLKQFDRWLAAHPGTTSATLRDDLLVCATERSRREIMGASPTDEIRDPIGRSARVWRSVAGELRESIDRILAGLFTH